MCSSDLTLLMCSFGVSGFGVPGVGNTWNSSRPRRVNAVIALPPSQYSSAGRATVSPAISGRDGRQHCCTGVSRHRDAGRLGAIHRRLIRLRQYQFRQRSAALLRVELPDPTQPTVEPSCIHVPPTNSPQAQPHSNQQSPQ